MSELSVTVCDANRTIHERVHGGFAHTVVAALSADPETIGELAAAMTRFEKVDPADDPFAGWRRGVCTEPRDSGICIVDLSSRLVACQTTFFDTGLVGEIGYHNGRYRTDRVLRYHISPEWKFVSDLNAWQAPADSGRAQSEGSDRLDVREVLYGGLCRFLVPECFVAHKSAHPDPIVNVHKRWLMTPRDELCGRTPRELLLADLEHLSSDLNDRAMQWSDLGECPPGIETTAAAYQSGGIGPHERILYHDLVRYLLEECWQAVSHNPNTPREALTQWLDELRQQWLATSHPELQGESPNAVITKERCRIPLVVSGEAAMVDHDCPLCQMMVDDMGPCFWILDDSETDDDFEFSRHATVEDWQQEQADWEAANSNVDEAAEHAIVTSYDDPDSDVNLPGISSIWSRCFSHPEVPDSESPIGVVLFGLGARLAELDLDLKERPDTRPLVERLNRDFGNLRESVAKSDSLVEPVVEKFCEDLFAATELRPDLTNKCADFEASLRSLAVRVVDTSE